MTEAQIYDPSDYLLEGQRSPGLAAIKPSLESTETPPPLATRDSSSDPDEEEETEKGPHREADYVLFSTFGPNYPETANFALKRLDSPPRPQPGDDVMSVDTDPHESVGPSPAAVSGVRSPGELGAKPREEDNGFEDIHEDEIEESRDSPPKINGAHIEDSKSSTKKLIPAPKLSPNKLDLKPPPLRPPPINIPTPPNQYQPDPDQLEDSLAKSPALARFTIPRLHGDPLNTLPAMQMSPPRSSTTSSPELKQTLPSLEAALSEAGTPYSASSPPFNRPSPGQTTSYTPNSAMSPPPLPLWRTHTSGSTPSDYVVSASGSTSTPNSSLIHQSPAASHPTPTSVTSDQAPRMEISAEYVTSPEGEAQDINGLAGNPNGTVYKCDIPDCTAAPFQTQYLLNSHMNVHSDTRPHFCQVPGCARGPGGQGFKRKNEMIR
jgi:hypothetical protein